MSSPKSVPVLVREFAKEWREDLFRERGHRSSPLQRIVDQYLHDAIPGLLDMILGIERRFGEARMRGSHSESRKGSILEELLHKIGPTLAEKAEKLVLEMPFVLTQKELSGLRKEFREKVLCQLSKQLDIEAEERATIMAKHTLDKLMLSDEWVALTEEKVAPGD